MLKDKEIRRALIPHLMGRSPSPAQIVEELSVDNGNAIADVVACYREMHCFEIKGQTDNVRRVLTQSEFYSKSFPKLTLVTTENHLPWAIKNLPEYWGILLAEIKNECVSFKYIRKVKFNSFFCKQAALMMLWKTELETMAHTNSNIYLKKSFTRADIANEISVKLSKSEALTGLQAAIKKRSSNTIYNKGNMGNS